jgi:hypothetical protein
MLELIFGTRTKIKLLQALAASDKTMMRNELAKVTSSGLRSTYEQVEELIALGVLVEKVNGRSKVALDPEFPLYESIRDLLLLSAEYFRTSQDVLVAVHRICGDNYYVGAFTAARQKITPVDYDPSVYMINILKENYKRLYPRLKTLGRLANIKVYEKNIGEAGDINIILRICESIPPDIIRTDFLGAEVWMASIERGIIECLTMETPFTLYGVYLSLLQNRLDNALDIVYLKRLAEEEGILPLVLAIMSKFNELMGKELFELASEEKRKAKGRVEEKELKHAVNTVMG